MTGIPALPASPRTVRHTISTSGLLHKAAKVFDDRVLKITAPGGKARGSYRLHFADRTVFACHRPKNDRAAHEARVLEALSPYSDDQPRYLGRSGHVIFQSDVGRHRVSRAAVLADAAGRAALADQAVLALFRIQQAAQRTSLPQDLRTLGPNLAWTARAVSVVDTLAAQAGTAVPRFDRDALVRALAPRRERFVKWDSRSGNAALDDHGRLRWFDFEYAGVRHGAEDFAWLIADENWAVDSEMMFAAIDTHFDTEHADSKDAYLTYLARYATIHALQRLKLILSQVQKRGWRSTHRVMKYDDVGLNPDLALRHCIRTAKLADRDPVTRPLKEVLKPFHDAFAAAKQGS